MWHFVFLFATACALPRAISLPPPVQVSLHVDRINRESAVTLRLATHGTARLSYLVQYLYSTDGKQYYVLHHNADHTGPVVYTPPCRTMQANATASLTYPYNRFFAHYKSESAFFKYVKTNVVFVKAVVKDCATDQEYWSPPIRLTNPSGY